VETLAMEVVKTAMVAATEAAPLEEVEPIYKKWKLERQEEECVCQWILVGKSCHLYCYYRM
jgi:hypothetical protein